jgi:hypothetical protein
MACCHLDSEIQELVKSGLCFTEQQSAFLKKLEVLLSPPGPTDGDRTPG